MSTRPPSSQPDMPPRAPLHPATLLTPPITTGPALHRSVRHAYPACPAPRLVATARSDDPSHSLPVHPDHSPRPGYVTPPPKSTGLSVPSASLPCPTTHPVPVIHPSPDYPPRSSSANSPTPTTLPSAIRMPAHPDYPAPHRVQPGPTTQTASAPAQIRQPTLPHKPPDTSPTRLLSPRHLQPIPDKPSPYAPAHPLTTGRAQSPRPLPAPTARRHPDSSHPSTTNQPIATPILPHRQPSSPLAIHSPLRLPSSVRAAIIPSLLDYPPRRIATQLLPTSDGPSQATLNQVRPPPTDSPTHVFASHFTPTTRVLAASTHSLPCRLPGAGPTSSNPTRLPRPFQHGSAPPASTSRPSHLVPSLHTDHPPHYLAPLTPHRLPPSSLHPTGPLPTNRPNSSRHIPTNQARPDQPLSTPQPVPPHDPPPINTSRPDYLTRLASTLIPPTVHSHPCNRSTKERERNVPSV
jgi:hypothetical protein